MSQDKPVAAQEPIAWQYIVSAIKAVAKEAASRGGMFPQEASEQREDSEAAKRVCGLVEWYATCGGSVAMRLPDWPLYDHAAPCTRCAELEAQAEEAVAQYCKNAGDFNRVIEGLQAKITELEEMHKSAAFNAKYYKSHYEALGVEFTEQVERIKALEAERDVEQKGVDYLLNTQSALQAAVRILLNDASPSTLNKWDDFRRNH